MPNNSAPCAWQLLPASASCPSPVLDGLPEEERERLIEMAVDLLWAWTGRKFGLCEVPVRPCRAECAPRTATFWGSRGGSFVNGTGWVPMMFDGAWFNVGCGACVGSCHCAPDRATSLALPGPVAGIVSITLDGELLDPAAYLLRDEVLYRIDGMAWPMCNDQSGDLTDPDSGAWEIVYQRGLTVPVGGLLAARRLAEELAKALCNDSSCQLPSNVQSVTRQGVSMDLVQTEFGEMKEGKTGIWFIDSWVASTQAPEDTRPAILSPDVGRGAGIGTFAGLGRGRTW